MPSNDFDFVLPLMKLIQDFVPYNESQIWDLSKAYYLTKGIAAWSDLAPKIIPHKSGSNYQNAINLLVMIKKLREQGLLKSRVRILECGAGSGRFSRHLLLAACDQGLLDDIELFVSDYAQKNLEEIYSKGILTDIKEAKFGKHYHLINLDVTAVDQARAFTGEPLKLPQFDVIFMHFVYDTLPLTILRKTSQGDIEELYVSMRLRKDLSQSVLENDFLQARIHKEFEWRPYDWSGQSPWELEFQSCLQNYAKSKKTEEEIFYQYTALKATQQLMSILNPNGFLFSSDIRPDQEKNSLVVGNSVAHEVDNEFLAGSLPGYYSSILTDEKISRIILSASAVTIDNLKNDFAKLYGPDNNIQNYIDLENQIESLIDFSETSELADKLDLLVKLAPYNARTFWLKAKYYELTGEKEKSKSFYDQAEIIDYWCDLG